jgi:hypothetical protein
VLDRDSLPEQLAPLIPSAGVDPGDSSRALLSEKILDDPPHRHPFAAGKHLRVRSDYAFDQCGAGARHAHDEYGSRRGVASRIFRNRIEQ